MSQAEQQVFIQIEVMELRAKHLEAQMRVAELERLVDCQRKLIEELLKCTTVSFEDLAEAEYEVELTVDEVKCECERTVRVTAEALAPIVHWEDYQLRWPSSVHEAELSVRHEEARHILRRL